jgi:hypothetical protein
VRPDWTARDRNKLMKNEHDLGTIMNDQGDHLTLIARYGQGESLRVMGMKG